MAVSLADRDVSNDQVSIADLVEKACRRIAPSWPLDQAIAVNPYVGLLDMSMREAASFLHFVAGSPLLMPHEWYGSAPSAESATPVMRCFSDLIDERRAKRAMTCRDIVTNSISQHCASYFDRHQAQWQPQRSISLYESWRQSLNHDSGLLLFSGIPNIKKHIAQLPQCSEITIARALEALHIPIDHTEAYLICLLYRINGWASWCAYLDRADDGFRQRKELLAICISYEWLFSQGVADRQMREAWKIEQQSWKNFQKKPCADSRWRLQENIESRYHSQLHQLLVAPSVAAVDKKIEVQAIFCIDVRSEVYRRKLENSASSVETRGTAGFFGLPMAYFPVGSGAPRSQVVQLLEPRYIVKDDTSPMVDAQTLAKKRSTRLLLSQLFSEWKRSSISKFSFVESFGFLFGFAMLVHTKNTHAPLKPDNIGIRDRGALKPHIVGLEDTEAISLAESILRGMSLVRSFAPIVCIIGHESCTTNNPQASSLDCGACGGQSGELNAQAVVELLNRPSVRRGLLARGIDIPKATWFCSGVHDTSNDEVKLHAGDVPPQLRAAVAEFESNLSLAGSRARRERLPSSRAAAYHWANVRPEWGLARNAAIIIGPRARTYQKSLDGRTFLQEYQHADDADGHILRSILGGPLIVAHWISMQYYASTVDPDRFGSGNKLLHNVVGGSIGVFEGNGGDLRIGVSRQALYHGKQLVHKPMRLAAWIEAPRERTAREILSQDMLCRMIAGDWITVFNLDPSDEIIHRATLTADDSGSYHLCWQPTLLSRNSERT